MNWKPAVKDSLVASALSAVLFLPLVGLVLHGQSLKFQLLRTAYVVAAVFLGRMLVAMFSCVSTRSRASEVKQEAPEVTDARSPATRLPLVRAALTGRSFGALRLVHP